jgi:formate dehydrogenase iron-sulfur subunit
MSKAVLIDITRCIGCRGCQAACKQWHDLPGELTHNTGSYQNPPWVSGKTQTMVTFNELEYHGKLNWVFAKRQCMHCEHPGCASACTVGALRKTSDGAVVYDAHKCIGCRYCQYACPFDVPAYEWDEVLGLIGKCDFCVDRKAEGLEPACVKACPTNALQFGDRDALLAEARRRIAADPTGYVNHIYGEHEVGGTSKLYLSGVPFAALGFPTLRDEPVSAYTEAIMRQTPVIAVTVAAGASALYWIIKRREMNQALAGPVAAAPAADQAGKEPEEVAS